MRKLFILRADPAPSVARARAMGLDPVALPLFRIEPLQWAPPGTAGFDALLLTSANAVRHSGGGLEGLRALPVHAVGKATAAAARDAGLAIASIGSAGVDGLLASLDTNLRLLHLCGEDRRPPQGARQAITAVPVYRAAALDMPVGFHALDGQVAAVHSPRAGKRLAELAAAAGLDRSAIRIAAISQAAAQAAGNGWAACEAAASPADEALLALAARLCEGRGEQ